MIASVTLYFDMNSRDRRRSPRCKDVSGSEPKSTEHVVQLVTRDVSTLVILSVRRRFGCDSRRGEHA
uniref:Uncharacterized protein n=1 Tax=Peronospora matthiolae TaxID=2874970 RepID=A0AAV1UFF8_9STRA